MGTCDPILLMDQMERQMQDIRDQIRDDEIHSTGSINDYLKDAYEIGEDGKVRIHILFLLNIFTKSHQIPRTTKQCFVF